MTLTAASRFTLVYVAWPANGLALQTIESGAYGICLRLAGLPSVILYATIV